MDESPNATSWTFASLLAGGILIVVGGFTAPLMMGGFGSMMGLGMMGTQLSIRGPRKETPLAWDPRDTAR